MLAPALALALALTSVPPPPVRVEPTPPAADQPFQLRIDTVWRDSCLPVNPKLIIGANRIEVTYTVQGNGCLSAVTPWASTVTIPGLAAGTHNLEVRVVDFDGPKIFWQMPVSVTGAPSVVTFVSPGFDTKAGNRVVRIGGLFPCEEIGCPFTRVFFGSVESPHVERTKTDEIEAVVPEQTNARIVDVTVRGATYFHRRPSAFTYLDISEFERIVLPIVLPGTVPGAFGSMWRSELQIVNDSPMPLRSGVDILFVEPRCSSTDCDPVIPPNAQVSRRFATPLFATSQVPPVTVYVRKEFAPYVHFQLRIRDVSREDETWGTEIPVVYERDLRYQLTLLDIPLRPGFRQKLRIYSPHYAACCALSLTFFSPEGATLATRNVNLVYANGALGGLVPAPYLREGSRELSLQPQYAELDLESMPELAGHDTVWIRAKGSTGIWAFVSVTHNTTQHVTTITPQ